MSFVIIQIKLAILLAKSSSLHPVFSIPKMFQGQSLWQGNISFQI